MLWFEENLEIKMYIALLVKISPQWIYFIVVVTLQYHWSERRNGPRVHKIVNASPPGQKGLPFSDSIFKCIFINKKYCILIQISLKSVPKGPIDSKSAMV